MDAGDEQLPVPHLFQKLHPLHVLLQFGATDTYVCLSLIIVKDQYKIKLLVL